jgi:hypothetical protein
MLAPALLKRAFGSPDPTQIGFYGSGCYDFEDSNLDLFRIYDYKKTTLYHGLNREDEFYLTEKNMRKPLHKRVRKWPSIQEFWDSNDPVEFRLLCSQHAQWRKFRRWLRKHLSKVEENPDFDYDKQALDLWGEKLDVCLGNFEEKGEVNTDMAIFNYSHAFFMTPEELKNLAPEQNKQVPVPPKMPDLSKAERLILKKDEMKVQEIQEEQERLSQHII